MHLPSQFCNISMLLKSFSEGKPSQCLLKLECWKKFNLLKWKYLRSSFLNEVYVLCTSVETFSDFSQWKYLLSSFLNVKCSTSVETFSDSSQYKHLLKWRISLWFSKYRFIHTLGTVILKYGSEVMIPFCHKSSIFLSLFCV